MDKNQQNESHRILIQKIMCLLITLSLAIFFIKIHLFLLCFLLVPIVFILTFSEPYQNINNSQEISADIENLCKEQSGKPEYAFYLTQFMGLIWPHIFLQERVDTFRDNLQWVIDKNPISGIESIHLTSLKLGDVAPQIVNITLPSKPLPAEDSVLLEMTMAYCPSFELAAILKVKPTLPDFNVTFTDISLKLDVLVQMEWTPDCTIPQMPFWTAMVFSLVKPPEIAGFNFQLFSASINKESLKNYLSKMASDTLWHFFGMPKGFFWDRVTGRWPLARVYGTNRMLRSSASLSYMLKYGQIKEDAQNLCKSLHIPSPLTIKTISWTSTETTTHLFEVLQMVKDNKSFEIIAAACEELSKDSLSDEEFTYFFEMVHDWMLNSVTNWTKTCLQIDKKKKEGMTKEINDTSSQVFAYVNFLNLAKKVNYKVVEQLKLEEKTIALEDIIFKFHKKLFKKTDFRSP